ncbi:MAG: hypothetical protein PVF22_03780 [Candidatus Aminicenantes bacterium]|jgi:hypothetical protein
MTTNPVRDWELERYLLGELPEERIREIEEQLKTDTKLQERLRVLEQSNEEILKQYSVEAIVPGIKERIQEEKRRKDSQDKFLVVKRLLYASPVLAAALVILFVLLQNPNRGPKLPSPYNTRVKGIEDIDRSKPHLLIYRKKDNDVELLKDGDTAEPGDLLQIAYGAAGTSYGVILSLDGSGVVTLHYPGRETESALLGEQKVVLLSSAYELDKAPDFERFFFITSESEIDVPIILGLARTLAGEPEKAQTKKLPLSTEFSQFSVRLKKGDLP